MRLTSRLVLAAALLAATLGVAPSAAGSTPTSAIDGGEAFLAGTFAEVGVRANGVFGTSGAAPTGFHPRPTSSPSDRRLGFVVDRDRDGWGVGTDDGDFFLPGSPYEAWGVRVGSNTGFNTNPGTEITGSLGDLVSESGLTSVTWRSDAPFNGLDIEQVISLRDEGQGVRVDVTLTNTTSGDLTDVAYIRSVDPDNNQSIGQGFQTTNTIDAQYATEGRAQVSASQADGSFITLLSRDPGAVASFAGTSSVAGILGQTGQTAVGATSTADDRIHLSVDVGTLGAGESHTFRIAYALSEDEATQPEVGWTFDGDDLVVSFDKDSSATYAASRLDLTLPSGLEAAGAPTATGCGTATPVLTEPDGSAVGEGSSSLRLGATTVPTGTWQCVIRVPLRSTAGGTWAASEITADELLAVTIGSVAGSLTLAAAPPTTAPPTTAPPTTAPPTTAPPAGDRPRPPASVGGGGGTLTPEQLDELDGEVPEAVERRATVIPPDGTGAWTLGADGGVFATGGARFHGSMGGRPLNAPAVGIAASPTGAGYWIVGADGGVFGFGDAPFHGSLGATPLNGAITGVSPRCATSGGYWLFAADGGVFAFGSAEFHGSMGGTPLNEVIVAMVPSCGQGYWLVGADGGVFAFGDASFFGSLASEELTSPVIGMIPTDGADGYWLVTADGSTFPFGAADD